MRVLMVLDEEFPPDVRVEKEAASLAGDGYDLSIICYTLSKQQEFEEKDNYKIFRIHISRRLYKLKALALLFPHYFSFWKKNIEKHLSMYSYDVLHVHDLTLIKPCIEIAKKYGMKIIGDYHENRPEIMKLYHHVNTLQGKLLISTRKWENYQSDFTPKLDKLILITEEAKSYYEENYNLPAEKIHVVPNYPDISQLLSIRVDQKIVDKYDNKFMVVYFGDTGIRRGTKTILQAAEILKDQKKFHFVIMGTSREQSVLEKIKFEKNLTNVKLTGYIPTEKAVSYIAAAKAGICPFLRNIHHDTTYANKLFQYMAFKKPVIVSDCPSQLNVVRGNDCGVIFKAGNANELSDKIIQMSQKRIYDSLSRNAFEAVQNKYNYRNAEKSLLKLYKQLSNEIKRS